MAIITGGILSEFGEAAKAHRAVLREIRAFSPRTTDQDYAVDVALATGHTIGPDPIPLGVSPGAVGRTQRRFIVWHRIPEGMTEVDAVRNWFVQVLPETENLVRTYLPTKSRAYPAEQLGDEVARLRRHLESPLPE